MSEDLVTRMRGFEVDHEPDGWPAIRMRDVSALCGEVESLREQLAAAKQPTPAQSVNAELLAILKEIVGPECEDVRASMLPAWKVVRAWEVIQRAKAAEAAPVAEQASADQSEEETPFHGVWSNERCQYGVCDEGETHDQKCKSWAETGQASVDVIAAAEQPWALLMCSQETGLEGWLAEGDEATMRGRMNDMAARGRDVWLIAPDGTKHLPTSSADLLAAEQRGREQMWEKILRKLRTYSAYVRRNNYQADAASVLDLADHLISTYAIPSAAPEQPLAQPPTPERVRESCAYRMSAGYMVGACGFVCSTMAYAENTNCPKCRRPVRAEGKQ